MSGPVAFPRLRVIAISGGVGGARLVDGLSRLLASEKLLVIANTADDFHHLDLRICPDLDTVMYTLAGVADPERGWGRQDESWHCLDALGALGGDNWFRLGDRDLAVHLLRSAWLRAGDSLATVTTRLCHRFGVGTRLVPMADQAVATMVDTDAGELTFQDYFVRQQCRPQVKGFRFEGIEQASPATAISEFIMAGPVDAVLICPSNPFVSVDPVLAVPGLRILLGSLDCPRVAVSPIIAGGAVKGPAAKMMTELGLSCTAASVAAHYRGFVDDFVLDAVDRDQSSEIERSGMRVGHTDILMRNVADRERLAHYLFTRIAAGTC